MMKRWKKIVLIASETALAMATLFTSTFAWFTAANRASLDSGLGYTGSSYFAGGDGSSSNPYIINKPINMYNLAWLQYLGFFNQNKDGAYRQVYFALGDNFDMTSTSSNNWTLPPIGTETYPFIGNFDGKGYTVSNLIVDNELADGHITRKPFIVTSLSGVNIVGTFGVVGDYASVLGTAYTYSSAANVVKNVYFDNVTVTSQETDTLIGVAAGYVNAEFLNVGVANSHINVLAGTQPLDAANLTSNLSDFSTVGYATDDYKKTRNVSNVVAKAPKTTTATFSAMGSGSINAWGGSIDMESMFNRLTTYQNNATTLSLASAVKTQTVTVDVSGTYSTNSTYYGGSFKEYYDSGTPLKGSYSFSLRTDGATSYIYLYGHKAMTKIVTTNTLASYKLYNGTNYISVSGTSIVNVTNSASAAAWYFTNFSGTGYIYTIIGGTRYYFYCPSTTLSLSTSASTQWYFSSSKLRTSGTAHYIRYYNSNWTSTTTSSTRGTAISKTTVASSSSSNETVANGVETRDTYFPLNVGTDGLPTATNTGYVISGSNYENPNSSMGYPYRSGDIRVSQYGISNISTALSGDSTYSDSRLEILTKTSKSGGNFVRIYDDYNASNNLSSSSELYSYTKSATTTNASALGLKKYTKSRSYVSTLLKGSSDIYGLHFMDASINSSNLAVATAARVNKANSDVTDYTNYQLPRNSIDFNLREKGFINFFSGTYFSGNDSFFSLHQIDRSTSDQSIASIKEISYIYQSSVASDPYIYQYSDGTYSATLTPHYSSTPIFDTSWIKAPTIVNNAVYYFEVPVNEGEYALGSVSGGTGAYLIYLDISANAQIINRTIVTDYVILTTNAYVYPLGVAVVASSSEGVNELSSCAVALQNGYSGMFSFVKDASTITFTSASDHFSPGYKGDAILLARSGSSDPPSVTPVSTSTSETKRLTYIDYNTATDETTKTIITNVDGAMTYSSVASDGSVSTPTEYYDNDGNLVTIGSGTVAIDVSGNTGDLLSFWYSYFANSSTITVSFAFGYSATSTPLPDGTTFTGATIVSYSFALTSSSDGLSVYVSVASGVYTLSINGVTVAVGSIVPVSAS